MTIGMFKWSCVLALGCVSAVAPSLQDEAGSPSRLEQLRWQNSSDEFFRGPPTTPPKNIDLESQMALWVNVNNSLLPLEARAEAEWDLMRARDARMLRTAFRGTIEPVEVAVLDPNGDEPTRVEQHPMPGAMGLHPGTGGPEHDHYMPVFRQIAHARGRIWSYLLDYAEPEVERRKVYESLFKEVEQLPDAGQQDWHYGQLVTGSRRNWTPEVREHLLSICKNSDRSASTRQSAAHALLDMHHSTPRGEHMRNREIIVATAWKERGTDFALRMGDRLGNRDDPRAALLRLDQFDHERRKIGRRLSAGILDSIDSYFDNISGLYLDRRSQEGHQEQVRIRDARMAFQKEARETGDDTKLRAFEAELAAKQQAELEERMKRIDAWIAANRDRLELEAADFARQREKEREKGRQGEPEPQRRQQPRGN